MGAVAGVALMQAQPTLALVEEPVLSFGDQLMQVILERYGHPIRFISMPLGEALRFEIGDTVDGCEVVSRSLGFGVGAVSEVGFLPAD